MAHPRVPWSVLIRKCGERDIKYIQPTLQDALSLYSNSTPTSATLLQGLHTLTNTCSSLPHTRTPASQQLSSHWHRSIPQSAHYLTPLQLGTEVLKIAVGLVPFALVSYTTGGGPLGDIQLKTAPMARRGGLSEARDRRGRRG